MIAPLDTIFRGLEGSWQLRRSLVSQLPGFPSGTFEGRATMTRHSAFNQSSYLYHETGVLITDQGLRLEANRKYIYRYEPQDAKISAWFVKEVEGQDDVDYLYHDLEFSFEDDRWVARGDHLCNMDMYWSFYDFRLQSSGTDAEVLERWGLKAMVKGPSKDYTSDTVYFR